MKWVTFISCLFLLSCTESKYLYRAYRDAAEPDTIKRASELGEAFEGIAIILNAQFLQHAEFQEVSKLAENTVALAKKCAADENSDPECKKPLDTVMFDGICHEAAIADKNGFTHCCAQTDPERHECFLTHKNESKAFILPYQKPDPEETCKKFHDNKQDVLKDFKYQFGIRHPFTKPVTILQAVGEHEKIMTACCQAEDKPACFMEKAPVTKKNFMKAVAIEKHQCSILKKFGVEMLQGYKIAQMGRKFPKAGFLTVTGLSDKLGTIYQKCCRGDTLDCMLDREKLSEYVCSHQGEISSKLGGCCEKPLLERGECIAHAENDEKPADLSPSVSGFFDNQDVCQHYADNKGVHLARFLHEMARINDNVPELMCLRVAKGYEELLEKCCPTDHAVTCLQEGEALLKKLVADSEAVVKANCDQFKQLGPYHFKNGLIISYARKAPQLSTEQLMSFTQKLTDVATQCCHLDDAHRSSCAVEKVDVKLGYLCSMHEEHHINKQVCKCCSESYPKRRECFSGLGVDPEYVPTPFDPKVATLHADYCSEPEAVQQEKKQIVLAHLLHHNPKMTDEQLAGGIVEFTTVVAKCCAEENKDECFNRETPPMIERVKALLGEQ